MWVLGATVLLLVAITGSLRAFSGEKKTPSRDIHISQTAATFSEDLLRRDRPHRYPVLPELPSFLRGSRPFRIESDGIVIDHRKYFIRIWRPPQKFFSERRFEKVPPWLKK